MGNSNETTTKFKVDISELKRGMQEASRQIRLANAEFKAATSGMDKWSNSADGITAKLKQLDSVLNAQKNQLKNLEKQYELTVKQEGAASKGAQELLIKINNQKAAIGDTEKQIRTYNSKLDDLEKASTNVAEEQAKMKSAINQLKNTIKDQENELSELKEKYKNIALEQGKGSDSAKELASQIDKLSGELKENKLKLNDVEDATDDLDQSLKDTTDGGISVFTIALGNLIADVVVGAINKLKDLTSNTVEVGKAFDSSMSNVAALSGATGEELEKLRDTAKKYGSTTKYSATEAADALGYMALAGWDANQSADALGGVLDLAAASNMDLAKASDIVTDYLSAFGMQANESSYFADLLAYAQANANTTTEGLSEAFKNCAADMNASGQDIETTTSLLSMLANQGLKGSEAGTALSATMRDITQKMAIYQDETKLAELAAAGYTSSTGDLNDAMNQNMIIIGKTLIPVSDASGNYRDMTDILKDVEAATNGMGDAEKAAALSATFTSDSIKGLNMILNSGIDEAAAFEEELRNSSGSAAKMAKIMQDNLGGDLTNLSSKFEGVQLAIYEKFEPALREGIKILDKLLDAVNFVIKHSDEFIAALASMATALGTYLAFRTAIQVMEKGWASLTIVTKAQAAAQALLNAVTMLSPWMWVVTGIMALVAAFVVLWKKSESFRNFWIGLWEKIKEITAVAVEAVTNFFVNAWDKIKEVWSTTKEFFSNLWDSIKEIFSVIADWVNENVFQPIMEFFQPVIDFFMTGFEIIAQLAEGCWTIIKIVWSVVSIWFNDNVIEPISKFFSKLWKGISDTADKTWSEIKKIWNVVSNWFDSKIIQPVSKFFSKMWSGLKDGASDAWSGIKSVFSPIADWFEEKFSKAWQKVKDVFSTGGKIFDGIKEGITDAFKHVVNAIIRGINKVIAIPFNAINDTLDKIRSVNIAGVEPFSGLISRFNIPEIPELAKGGVLRKGKYGFLEGDGDEAVVPLEKNTGWLDEVADRLYSKMNSSDSMNFKSSNITNNFYQTNNSPKSLSRLEIYRQSKNLLRMKGV